MIRILCSSLLFFYAFIGYAHPPQPKLIVQIVVDQLRGDLIHNHQHQMGSGGFNYLISHGINFNNAHHPHANTTTCAGHATIATGSYPSIHGVIDNDWFDRNSKNLIYCMEDLNNAIVSTIHTKKSIPGRSPKNLQGTTLSDEISLANKGKVFAVSLKDRAAITLAGHSGKAFWFDKINGGFVSSRYYYTSYPQWVQTWNAQYKPVAFDWTLSQPITQYQNSATKPFKEYYGDFNQTFPHHVSNPPSESYFKSLSRTPKADQLTADFAEQLLINEQLGTSDNKTDYLGISFSAVDAIGHQFGPNSLEAEDNLMQLDKTLSHLLSVIDKQTGLENTLIILTADHGVSDSPTFLKSHNIPQGKPFDIAALEQAIKLMLSKEYQLPPETLMSITPPYIYLNHQLIAEHKLSVSKVSRFISNSLIQQPGIYRAYPLPVTNIEEDWLTAKVNRMAYPYRAGDVYLIPPPYQSLDDKQEDTVSHGTPWQYDSYVPLLFVNPKFEPKLISRPVYTTDIASTLSALLGINPPSGAVGAPLKEVVEFYRDVA
ncbi:alkaline phosphatase [Legionella moravica]|uniref:Alkaline phosphatase n=1 Tax=Legionella moravica TaxID=39962 RepID=A0A378JVD4_9GAMM|nr:alkaline phosphatase family protein [Legionella moravica]KTD32289.1 alkaline phosphatase [Legionella moravica]STX62386.1 alkaline phosphatase [Legionella moravica]